MPKNGLESIIKSYIEEWFYNYCDTTLEEHNFKYLLDSLNVDDINLFINEVAIDFAAENDYECEWIFDNYQYIIEEVLEKLIINKYDELIRYKDSGELMSKFNKDNMNKLDLLESRVEKLENYIKNEFLGFGKPKRSDEAGFVKSLFDKYPTIRKALHQAENPNDSKRLNQPFHLVLVADDKYNDISFVMAGQDKDNMYCSAFDKNSSFIDKLKPFSLSKDVNKVARFIIDQLQNNINKNAVESFKFTNESVPLTTMDCESLRQIIEDNFDDLPEIEIDITDDNADYGFINVGIFNPEYIADYDIIANEADEFEVTFNDKTVGTAKSLEDAADILSDHFIDNYINGKLSK